MHFYGLVIVWLVSQNCVIMILFFGAELEPHFA